MATDKRRDDDRWTVASGVGRTALVVALGRAIASQGRHPRIDDPFAEPLVLGAGVPELAPSVMIDRSRQDPDFGQSLKFLVSMMAARTSLIDNCILDANARTCSQVVIVASGLDARAMRLTWGPGTTVFEIDQPDVVDYKLSVLEDLGSTSNARWIPIACDLRGDWLSALKSRGFDDATPTCWLGEGLLPYLRSGDQEALLATISSVASASSELFIDPPFGGHVDPSDFGISSQGYGVTAGELFLDSGDFDARAWLEAHGWTTTSTPIMPGHTTFDERFAAMAASLRLVSAQWMS